MPRKINDSELDQYAEKIGRENYRDEYRMLYRRTMQRGNRRFSGKHYENSPEKIKQPKEKYKNGISLKTINEMLELNL